MKSEELWRREALGKKQNGEKSCLFFLNLNFPTATNLARENDEVKVSPSPRFLGGCLSGGGGSRWEKKIGFQKTRDPKHDRKSEELDTHAGGGKKIGA